MKTAMMNTVAMAAFAACALVAYPARAQPTPPPPAQLTSARSPAGSELRVALALSAPRSTTFFSDGHYEDVPRFDAGIEAEYFHVPERVFHWGVGLRYGLGVGSLSFGTHETEIEHLAFLPLLIGWSARFAETGNELEVNLGLGPAFGAFSVPASSQYVRTGGIGGELGVKLVHPISRDLAITGGLTARLMTLSALQGTGGAYFNEGFHGEIPFHLGVRYRL